jgi:tRNA A37 methylthiotransferase MiaB
VSLADHRARIGQTVQVLVEGLSKSARKLGTSSGPVQLTGRTPTDHIVAFDGNTRLIGKTVSVSIEEASSFTLFGSVVTGETVGALGNVLSLNRHEAPSMPGRFNLPLLS